ncbi:MAG: hypothetical protein JWP63_6253 [Candidatus Solibacter sp.]|jgi:hypothetical protein|nr:hypothetical protein [Candidatus Solibacter sp.]
MKALPLIFWLAVTASAQTQSRQCGASFPISAANRDNPRDTISPKPETARQSNPTVLPQIQYRRTPPSPRPGCWCGTVAFTALTSATLSQEVMMLSGITGRFRFDHVLIQEAKRFSSDRVERLAVSVGRPDTEGEMIWNFALKSDRAPENFVFQIPNPPALTGTYDLVLKFVGSSPLATEGSSNFSAGSLNWEVCGGQV